MKNLTLFVIFLALALLIAITSSSSFAQMIELGQGTEVSAGGNVFNCKYYSVTQTDSGYMVGQQTKKACVPAGGYAGVMPGYYPGGVQVGGNTWADVAKSFVAGAGQVVLNTANTMGQGYAYKKFFKPKAPRYRSSYYR